MHPAMDPPQRADSAGKSALTSECSERSHVLTPRGRDLVPGGPPVIFTKLPLEGRKSQEVPHQDRVVA
jgi:hypothetical protein